MVKRPTDIKPFFASAAAVNPLLDRLCSKHGIDLAGVVSLPCELPNGQNWQRWIKDEHHANLEYLARDPEARIDPNIKNPWARTMFVFAQRYTNGWSADDSSVASNGSVVDESVQWSDRVSRYARGLDYHDVLLRDIRKVLAGLKQEFPQLIAFPATDTGPYLEREYAWLAGLGFLGKNHCLINEKLGSGVFLGVAIANLELDADRDTALSDLVAPPSRCGSCTRCIDACPTNALDVEKGLLADRCLSTWTIEWQGQAPEDERSLQGGILFGCDICQAVCPWNLRAARSEINSDREIRSEYELDSGHNELKLADLVNISDGDFRQRFRKTPIWRGHPAGLRKNARTVLENIQQLGAKK